MGDELPRNDPTTAPDAGGAVSRTAGPAVRGVGRRSYTSRPLTWLLAAVVAVALALAGYFGRWRPAGSGSVAVVPFQVRGGDADAAALADGVREALTDALCRLARLRVIAAASTSRLPSDLTDPQRIGRELGVTTVVTGRLAQQGDTVEINAELFSAADGARLWDGTFIRPLTEIAAVQDQIAVEVARRVRPGLARADVDLLRTRQTTDVAAYQLYLKGLHRRRAGTPQGQADAIACFKQALVADPGYALAHAGVAECLALLARTCGGAVPPSDARPQAFAAAERAVAIDARLPEAHAALGLVTWQFNGDRAAAEQALRRAIELAPAYADAHRWYAGLLAESGRAAEADAEIRRTLALDPLTPGVVADQGLFALYARRWELAIDRYRAVLAVEPRSVSAHLGMALAEAQQHRFEAALDEIAAAGAGDSGDGSALATRAVVLGMAGRSAEARAAAAELQQLAEQRHVPAYRVAVALAGAGDADAAFSWLDKACEERCPPLGAAAVDPGLDRLRGDRRLAEVLRCAGLAR